MNKLWMVLLLFCSVSSFAAKNADYTLKWKEEPKTEDLPEKNNDLQGYRQASRPRSAQMFSYIDKANRMRFSDPQFSTYNSDSGSSLDIYIGRKPE